MNKYLIIDIGGTYIKYAIIDQERTFIYKNKVLTPHSGIDEFYQTIDMIYQKHGEDIKGIGISSAGVIDSDNGYMHTGGSLMYISNLDITKQLSTRYNIPVTIENDAKCAALAEVWCGSLQAVDSGIVMICGTAVGGAIIHNRQVLRGANFMSGEFSFLVTNAEKPYNGNYNFAMTGGVPALISSAADKLGCSLEAVTGEHIFELANSGNEDMLELITNYARSLAIQINNLQFIVDPELVAIGGGISSQPLLITKIELELKKINSSYPFNVPLPKVTACQFFNDSNLLGALYVHLTKAGELCQ